MTTADQQAEYDRRYREKHRARINERQREWRKQNKDDFRTMHTRSRQRPEYKEMEKQRVQQSRRTNPFKFSLQQVRRRAKTNGWEFDLDIEYLKSLWTGICPILNVPIHIGSKAGTVSELNTASLDRLDSSKGYVKGNVQYISFRANNIKTDASFDEFERIYFWWKDRLGTQNDI